MNTKYSNTMIYFIHKKYNFLLAVIFIILLNNCGMNRLVVQGAKTIIHEDSKSIPISKDTIVFPKMKGIYKIGQPYKVNGIDYIPKIENNYLKTGIASWYGPKFHNKLTANGEIFDQDIVSAAHKTLPLPSIVMVKNLENNKELVIRVNDRGPFVGDRIIDLSKKAAEILGFLDSGIARVKVKFIETGPHLLAQKYRLPLDDLYPNVALDTSEKKQPIKTIMIANGIFIQLGAFSKKIYAENMIVSLIESNLENISKLDYVINNDKELFKVLLGPLQSLSKAKNIANQLSDLGYNVHLINNEG